MADVTTESVKAQLRKLVDLQKVDTEIYEYKNQLKDKPALVQELKTQYESKKAHLHELESRMKTLLVERKSFELEMQDQEQKIAKAAAGVSALKTNKEYQARLYEIENMKADLSLIEEKIIESFDKTDALAKEVDAEKAVLAVEEKAYLEKKKEVDDLVIQLEDAIQKIDVNRRELLPGIDKDLLSRYERILENKHGSALVPVLGMACGGCYMNVTAQTINRIRIAEEIVICEMCARMLYLEDSL
jgi:predicted  nucleic acid-binding Zn-ribbon protein